MQLYALKKTILIKNKSNMKKIAIIVYLSIICSLVRGQEIKFAFLADTHLSENSNSITDLQQCIKDINSNKEIQFSIFAGDITEFGSDKEILLAKGILDQLHNPYYIVAGNHDSKWSESGCNTFSKVFGYEHFEFEKGGIKFIGCNSGPDMRMAPALVPRESIVWLDSLINNTDREKPIIFVNHYPMDSSVLNCFEVVKILKKGNTLMTMGGHWHNNVKLNFDGIPGILGRSSQERGKEGAGYNIVTITNSLLTIQERVAERGTKEPWFSLPLDKGADYSVNSQYPKVKEKWTIQEDTNIGSAAAVYGDKIVYATTSGVIKCISLEGHTPLWEYKTKGKIFSTPAISGESVVVGSCDNTIYCLNLNNGETRWTFGCNKSVLASPAIFDGIIYIGASDGVFRAIELKTGKLVWEFADVKGFIESKAFVDKKQVVVGDWANTLYSFNRKNGKLMWKWNTKGSRMYSPAAVWAVKSDNKIFIVTPERKTYAIDAAKGETIWQHRGGRESIGISNDGTTVYTKTMKDTVFAFSATSPKGEVLWASNCSFGYEIAPTPITTSDFVFIPTDKGFIIALDPQTGNIVWKHRVSHALINCIIPLPDKQLVVTTLDGRVSLISYGE